MAELEIIYIPYGLDEISQLDLMASLANGIDSYLGSKNWAKKDKYRQAWLNAYQDIMSKGILGASNDTGMWRINHKGPDIDMSGMSNIQREMYGDAAYYIQLLMARMTPRVKEEDKKKDENKTKFDNAEFNTGLTEHIGTAYYGGLKSDVWNKDWAELDPEERGIRGTALRLAKMAEYLDSFRNQVKANLDKYSFEDTPYGSFDEWNNRVDRALEALRNSEWNDDDKNALNALGINHREWFKTGADEPVTLTDGSTMTRAEFNAAEDKLKTEKVAVETATKDKLFHLENDGVLSTSSGNKAIDAVHNTENYNKWLAKTYGTGQEGFNKINSRVQLLLEKSYNLGKANGLNQAERKELGNLLHYIRTNNPKYLNYNLTPEEEGELGKHNSMKGRRLLDFVRLPWQTSDGRYTYADKSGNVYFLKPLNKKQLLQQSFTKSLAYNDYVKNFGKGLLQINNETPVLNLDKDVLISDVTSMLGDIISLGGGYAGAAGGITTILSDLYGDIRRGKDTWGVIKNLGTNIAWGVAGLIPGAKLGKVAKNAARVYAVLQSAGILTDPGVQLSWKNLIEGKDITAKDFENFKWTLHAITGGTNAARGHLTERNINKLVKKTATIETKSGNKLITLEQVNKVNKVGGKKGLKAAEEEFQKLVGAEAKEGSFKFNDKPRTWYNPNKHSRILRNLTSDDEKLAMPKTSVNQEAVTKLLEIDKAKPIIGIGNPFNKKFWNEGGPNRGGLTFALSPYKNTQLTTLETPKENLLLPSKNNRAQQAKENLKKKEYSNPKEEYNLKQQHRSEREIEQFLKSYGEKGKVSNNSFSKGYGSNTNKVKNGEITVELGDGIKFSYKVNNASDYNGNPGKVATLRGDVAKKIQELLSSTKKIDRVKVGKVLQDLKRKGWLKQGGTINNNNLDTTILNFFKNNNI